MSTAQSSVSEAPIIIIMHHHPALLLVVILAVMATSPIMGLAILQTPALSDYPDAWMAERLSLDSFSDQDSSPEQDWLAVREHPQPEQWGWTKSGQVERHRRSDEYIRVCGQQLRIILSTMCPSFGNGLGKRAAGRITDVFSQQGFNKRGVTSDCCYNSCSKQRLLSYCPRL